MTGWRSHGLIRSTSPVSHLWKYNITIVIEQFSNDCRKANSKVITPSNHKRSVTRDEPIKFQAIACNLLKARKITRTRFLSIFSLVMTIGLKIWKRLTVLVGGMFTLPVSVRGSLTLLASTLYYFPFTTLCNPHRVLLLSEDSHSH